MATYEAQPHEIELTVADADDGNDGMVLGFDGKMHRESSMHHEHEKHPEDAGGTIVKWGIIQKGWPFDIWSWKKVFIQSLHEDVQVLHEKNVKLFWILSFLTWGFVYGLFIYFAYFGLIAGFAEKYISLDPDSGKCTKVGAALTTVSSASRLGVWEGSRTFKWTQEKFRFEFKGFDGLKYEDYITDIFTEVVNPIGAAAVSRPSYWNVLTWLTYTNYDFRKAGSKGREVLTTFQFAGDASAVFDRKYSYGYVVNGAAAAVCFGDITFDRLEVTNTFSWEVDEVNQYIDNGGDCDTVFPDVSAWGYEQGYGSYLNLEVDHNTFVTTVALNLGIINSTALEATQTSFDANGAVVNGYVDPSKPGMKPLFCTYDAEVSIEYDDDYSYGTFVDDASYRRRRTTALEPYCYLQIGNRLCLPVFKHYYSQCFTCASNDEKCDYFDFMSYCIFDDDYDTLFALPELHTNEELFEIAETMGQSSDFTDCPTCIILVLNTYDELDYKINVNFLQTETSIVADATLQDMEYAHCADSFSVPEVNWKKIKNIPPSPLFQDYYECQKDAFNVIIDALGIAFGNSSLYAGTIIAAFVFLFMAFVDNFVPEHIIKLPDDEEKIKILHRLNLYPG